MTCKVDYTYITQLKLQKVKNKVILQQRVDILAMCCRIISPFYFLQF